MRRKKPKHFLRHLKNSESGLILFTVLGMTIVFSMVVIGFMSSSVSQSFTSQSIVDQTIAQQLSVQELYKGHEELLMMNQLTNSEVPGSCEIAGTNCFQNPDGKSYRHSVQRVPATNSLQVDVSY